MPHRPGEHLEALLVLHAAPREHERLAGRRAPRPSDHHVGSMPLGMRWVRSGGSSKPPTISRTMNRELASTSSARWASHDSTAWIVLGSPGGTRPPWWPRLGARGTWRPAGRRSSAASVSAAQATCQSWAWTMSGPPRHEPRRQLHEVVVGRRDAGDEVVVRAATAGRCGPAARARRRVSVSAGDPGWASVSSTTSCPAAAIAWLSPSTWAATPPTERGGNSQVSIRTRIVG